MEEGKQSSSRKRPKVDRLSSLPDSIICHILSFLPTNFSVATSILARRWRFLWADVPTIDLSSKDFCQWPKDRPRFPDIINRVLLGYNLKALNTFRLLHHETKEMEKFTEHQLETWISAAIARGKVRNLELVSDYWVKLPERLFTYKSLVELRLEACEIRTSLPAAICFPSLKKLHLCTVQYNNDETFEHLILGCSLLEELIIEYIVENDLVCYRISSPTLKWLTINFGIYVSTSWSHDYRLEISTPALRHLQLQDHLSECISAQVLLTCLTKADITLMVEEGWTEIKDDVVYSGSVLEFVDKMCYVKCLKLQTNYKKFLHSIFSISTVRYHNLIKLELAADWRFIWKLLATADNLQVLVIHEVDEGLKHWEEPRQAFTCLLSHLRSVVITSFGNEWYDFDMVRYFLKNAKVLMSMEIYPRGDISDYKKNFGALQRISLFERGSEACKLGFY